MLETYERHSKRNLLSTIVSVIVIAGIVVFADHMKSTSTTASNVSQSTIAANSSQNATTTQPQAATNTSSSTTSSSASSYKDGTYTDTADYSVPHGDESIEVSLTLSNGTITDASVQNSENDPTSAQYQEDFAAAYKSYVVGKNISGLQLDVVSGASDTSQGFDDALSKIASESKA